MAALVLANLVDLHDMVMAQPGDRLGFAAKTHDLFLIRTDTRPKHFEGHHAPETFLPGLVDDAHAAMPQFFHDLIAGNYGHLLAEFRAERARDRGQIIEVTSRLRRAGGR